MMSLRRFLLPRLVMPRSLVFQHVNKLTEPKVPWHPRLWLEDCSCTSLGQSLWWPTGENVRGCLSMFQGNPNHQG